jgi:hypothetical protein
MGKRGRRGFVEKTFEKGRDDEERWNELRADGGQDKIDRYGRYCTVEYHARNDQTRPASPLDKRFSSKGPLCTYLVQLVQLVRGCGRCGPCGQCGVWVWNFGCGLES